MLLGNGLLPHFGIAGGGWWTLNGQTCVAAYQPKGVASLALSYVNRANPGTYDAAPGVAPTHGGATGWTFATTDWLSTGIVPTGSYSMIVRFSGASGTQISLAGARTGWAQGFFIVPRSGGTNALYDNGGRYTSAGGALTAGTICIAGSFAYLNGTLLGAIPTPVTDTTHAIYIGKINDGGTPLASAASVIVACCAVYSTTLSAGDVATLTTRMAAL
jgi:hypothetical protein